VERLATCEAFARRVVSEHTSTIAKVHDMLRQKLRNLEAANSQHNQRLTCLEERSVEDQEGVKFLQAALKDHLASQEQTEQRVQCLMRELLTIKSVVAAQDSSGFHTRLRKIEQDQQELAAATHLRFDRERLEATTNMEEVEEKMQSQRAGSFMWIEAQQYPRSHPLVPKHRARSQGGDSRGSPAMSDSFVSPTSATSPASSPRLTLPSNAAEEDFNAAGSPLGTWLRSASEGDGRKGGICRSGQENFFHREGSPPSRGGLEDHPHSTHSARGSGHPPPPRAARAAHNFPDDVLYD